MSLRVTTGSPEELIEKMERGDVDPICILDEPRYSNSWHKCNEVPEEVVFVASPGLDLGHPGPYRVEELLDKPFFLTERNANYRHTFDNFLASRQIELTPALEISDTAFIIKMLERSSGISLLPRFAVTESAARGGCGSWRCRTSGSPCTARCSTTATSAVPGRCVLLSIWPPGRTFPCDSPENKQKDQRPRL